MGHISYLSKRGSVYYARLDVPEDLVPILKTQTKKLSLKTKDEAEAKRRLWPGSPSGSASLMTFAPAVPSCLRIENMLSGTTTPLRSNVTTLREQHYR